jgi:hypothetical protein
MGLYRTAGMVALWTTVDGRACLNCDYLAKASMGPGSKENKVDF